MEDHAQEPGALRACLVKPLDFHEGSREISLDSLDLV